MGKKPAARLNAEAQAAAIREAIETLLAQGREITTAAILWLLQTRQITVQPGDIYASVAWQEQVAREKGLPTEAPSKAPEIEGNDMPKGKKAEEPTAQSNGEKITKMDAVRQAISSKGKDIKPADIVIFVKDNFGLELSLGTATNYKSAVLKERGEAKNSKGPKKVASAPAPRPAAAKVSSGDGISLEEIAAVKALVEQMGAKKVQQLAAVLGK